MSATSDEIWMDRALALAAQAAEQDEVPVGAVVVRGGEVLGEGFNCPVGSDDPTAHAEIQALRAAARKVGNYRLPGATLYVTVEPCTMCAGAIIHARISRLVYGVTEPKAGAVESRNRLLEHEAMNWRVEVLGAVRADESRDLLQGFFARRRAEKRAQKQKASQDDTQSSS
ncbi:tRNA adenosine(34) deaminase TadA [Marinobacteraceae bacterium S3BR75-40.1]